MGGDPPWLAQARAMRAGGATYAVIGKAVGRSASRVHTCLTKTTEQQRERARSSARAVLRKRRAEGRCGKCGGEPDPGNLTCAKCLETQQARNATPAQREARERYRQRLADAAIAAYGGRCACCGQSDRRFLTFDHVHRDGAAHRREIGPASTSLHLWLAQHGYPESVRLLCANCNLGRERNGGVCPHEEDRAAVTPLRAVG